VQSNSVAASEKNNNATFENLSNNGEEEGEAEVDEYDNEDSDDIDEILPRRK
jgi:hypothetical protein